ncbi:tetratricopeptide repeat protein [Psychromarinibacter sp. C21-152]|uniref:Tetratricopeptide repeat protein n=1 Tax=Psychromarinibacter sediminicola TaxID=3033385 RepID=A0AAE3NTJ4_9RHOB|nr:tetratricopeptide repeat protein [Psychromarinibacter sediminicola]MDF0601394.1 tetratricopeptide repeat protein [Psychromarinibacter sediminicola]
MHDSDSFIEEVSEAVRRDRLFGYFRKYGWIALVVVLLIVGGAAWREYSKAQQRAEAQAQGDRILAALDAEDAAARHEALAEIETGDGAQAVVEMLAGAEALAAGDPAAAAEALRAVEENAELDPVYRQMATLKRVMLMTSEMPPQERIDALAPLTTPGAAFRVLAEEQIALAEIEQGDREAALSRLRSLVEDTEATGALRQRANRLILALGGEPDAA